MNDLIHSKSRTTLIWTKRIFAVLLTLCLVLGNLVLSPEISVAAKNKYCHSSVTKIKSIKNPADLYVDYGTSKFEVLRLLPSKVEVVMENNTTSIACVNWISSDYNPCVKSTKSFTFTGNVKGTKITAKMNVIVVSPCIKKIQNPSPITVVNGTSVGQLNLPEYVSVTLSDKTTSQAKVVWDTSCYQGNTKSPATYMLKGVVEGTQKVAIQIVKVGKPFLAFITTPSAISVENGTTIDQVKTMLPKTVELVMSNGTKSTAKVTWDTTGYQGEVTTAKEFLFPGTVKCVTLTTKISVLVAAPKSPWTLVWSDEFDGTGTKLDTNGVDLNRWAYQNGTGAQYGLDGWGNNEQQYYTSQNIKVSGGNLVITPKMETIEGKTFTSGRLWTSPTFIKKYGKFEARIKLPKGKGFWPAFWMMPKNDIYGGWAASGEIDIMEARGAEINKVAGTLHYGGSWPNNKYTGKDYNFPSGESIAEYHTYSVEWEPGEIRWYVDGILYQTQNNWSTTNNDGEKYAFPAPFDQDFYIILNLAIGGNFVGNVNPGTEEFATNPTMEVDYVRVYELTGKPYKTPVEPKMEAEPAPVGGRVPDATGNLIYDNNYEKGILENAEGVDANFGEGWNFIHNAQFGGQATAAVESLNGRNFAKVDVTNVGNQVYSVQLEQHTTLTKGRWYQLSFDAKADSQRSLSAKLGGGSTAGWAVYSDAYSFDLSTELQSFSKVFQMTKPSDILTRLEFNCATSKGIIWIGNVKLMEVDPPQIDYNTAKEPLPVSKNYIYNGAFDKYTIDRFAYWNLYISPEAAATANVLESTRELSVTITNAGTTSNSIRLVQKGLQLLKTEEYQVNFKARAASNRTVEVSVLSNDGTTNYSATQTIALTTGMEEKTFTFTMPEITDNQGQLVINLSGNNSTVYLDDVKILRITNHNEEPETPPTEISNTNLVTKGTNLVSNGDFTTDTTGWETWWGDQWSGYSTGSIAADNGKLKIHLESIGGASYSPQVLHRGLNLEKGKTYVVSFKARADIARKVNVNIGKELTNDPWFINYAPTKVIDLTTTEQQYTYAFTVTESTDTNLKIVFEVGNVAGGAAVTDIYLDDVTIQEAVMATVPDTVIVTNPASLLTNGEFSTDTANWGSWWGDQWSGYATGEVTLDNGKLKIHLASIGGASYSPQILQEGFGLENGKSYMVSFKASADVARKVNVNIGKGLDKDPWFIAYAPTKVADLSTNEQQYTYVFTVKEATDSKLKIVFEVGNVAGGAAITDIYLDDVTIQAVK